MPKITKITVQKRNKERYNVFTDKGKGEEYAFSLDQDVLIKYQLKKGMELDDILVAEMLYKDDIRRAYHLAIHYLSRRMRSEGEVREHLHKKEISEPIIQEVVKRLTEQKYLNDQEFAIAYVRTQVNTTEKGPSVIRLELKDKGVKQNVIEEALSEFPLETQVDKAILLGNKFVAKNNRDSSIIIKQKLEQLLLRKGYSFHVINIAVEEIQIEKHSESEMEALRYQGDKLKKKLSKFTGYEFEQKMKQKLFNKGFSIERISQYLDEIENCE